MSKNNNFANICNELNVTLRVKEFNITLVNRYIDELNANPFIANSFTSINDITELIIALCSYVKLSDEFLVAKTSHLLVILITKEDFAFHPEIVSKILVWHLRCVDVCSKVILADLLHGVQCILQYNPVAGSKHAEELISKNGILLKFAQPKLENSVSVHNPLHITLISLKCICALTSVLEDKSSECEINNETKQHLSDVIVNYLYKGSGKNSDEFLYYKVVVVSLRILSLLYLNTPPISIPLQLVFGICRSYMLLGLNTGCPIESVTPSQQIIAPSFTPHVARSGKKQKLRKHRNNAIESLKKDLPVSDRSLMRIADNFENASAYQPVNQYYLEPQKSKTNPWPLTSDSEVSDAENGREVKLGALKSRVRQSASNLLLVLVKVSEKKDIIGYWWCLLPGSPDHINCLSIDEGKKTLAYCAVYDPMAGSRANALSVILALLAGSRMYLSQAEASKKETTSFIPFSVSLGYTINCMHKVLCDILESERVQSVIIVALKCCAALVQATPYHKMQEGLITKLIHAARRFLLHRDTTLQVGALITIGCVLSIDPKVPEVLKSIEKDSYKPPAQEIIKDECDDFEEEYSDDELFVETEQNKEIEKHCFNSWILDICFRNLGWVVKNDEIVKCKPSQIPVILESQQVLSSACYHHFRELVAAHVKFLADVLHDMLQYEHQDVILQAAKTVSVVGDAIQRLEQSNQAPPLTQCVYLWDKLLTPLSSLLQGMDVASKAVACDCIANIGERAFKELPRRSQVLCCTLLMGSCSDEDPTVRAAAVRALAMTVMYRTLREDICFVSDCGENILRALSEQSMMVKTKAAWALGNLTDALILNSSDPEIDVIDDDLLYRLLEASVQCASSNDKIRMSATRGLGNILRLITGDNLTRVTRLKPLCELSIERLLECACKATNMKVRWNACYAIGNAMKNPDLFSCFNGWQREVYPSLCTLTQDCKNIKVRINAAVALRSPNTREHYGEHYTNVWKSVMLAMENAANIDDFNEYKHKDNLIEQLCVTLAHLCCLLQPTDLPELQDPLSFHSDTARALTLQLSYRLAPENTSCLRILEAAKHVTVDLVVTSDAQQQSLGMLQEIFILDM